MLVLCEPGRAGDATLAVARELAEVEDAQLTVVAVAPRAPSGSRCGNSALEYNEVVADFVARDLDSARARLGAAAGRARFELLVEGADPTVAQFAAAGDFDLVLLPARRRPLRAAYHPEAARLKLAAGAEVRILGPSDAGAGRSGLPARSPRR